jgi:hypothetical protein
MIRNPARYAFKGDTCLKTNSGLVDGRRTWSWQRLIPDGRTGSEQCVPGRARCGGGQHSLSAAEMGPGNSATRGGDYVGPQAHGPVFFLRVEAVEAIDTG